MEFNPDAVDLEEAFFAEQNARLLERLRAKAERAERHAMLRRVVGVEDEEFLDRLLALGITPERAMVLRLTPLVFVAWAGGAIEPKEREAILRAAARHGLAVEEMAQEVLGDWLVRRPDPRILEMWKTYIRSVWSKFTADEQEQMRHNLLAATREVAQAAGGVLGLRSISAAERQVLDDLEAVVR